VPRRDVGDLATTYGSVGMFNTSVAERQEKNKSKWRSICEGDRVVVIKGREKGKIAVVQNYDNDRGSVKLEGLNMGDVNVPEWAQQEQNSEEHMMAVAFPIPVEDVRLVYPLPDEDGIPRDVVVDRLERVNEQWDPVKRERDDGERAIPGTNTLIPWPAKYEPDHTDHPNDTLRISVEEETSSL
jgi:large subunit ribosomal protein L24